jgi:sigma-E factor negative regulatory protein RseB
MKGIYFAAAWSLFAAGVAAAAGCPGTDERALKWLDKMSHSLQEISYEGVVTLQRGSDMRVMRVSHTVGEDGSSEVLTELTGKGARVERTEHPLNCLHPGMKLLRASTPDDCGIAAEYRLHVADGDRIAGRNAVRIIIEPKDIYRFGYVMSLDRDTGLLLKTQTMTSAHKTLETMQFAHLTYKDSVPAASEAGVTHRARHSGSGTKATAEGVDRAWKVGWLPSGFTATDSTLGTSGRRTYTDGLAVFSIFLENFDQKIQPGEGAVNQGGTTTYTRGMRLEGRPVLVTVIGEVPLNTARMVADSVRWVE